MLEIVRMQQMVALPFLSLLMAFATGLPIAHAADRETQEIEIAAKIKAGNRALQAGRLDEARQAYQEAATLDPENDAAVYNQAVVLYRAGELAKAADLFQRAAASETTAIAAKARFNLGNTAYAQSLQSIEQDPSQAVESLQRAIEHYRDGLSLDPADEDARANIELAAQLLQQLQSQEEQDEEQQQKNNTQDGEQQPSPESPQQNGEQKEDDRQGQDGDQEMQQDSDEESQQEGDSSQQPGETEEPAGSGQDSPPEDSDGSDQQEKQQKQAESGEASENGSQPDDPASAMEQSPTEQPGREDAPQEQPDPGPLDNQMPDDASEQEDPTGQLGTTNPDDGDAGKSPAGRAALDESATMTLQEAQKMLQAIRDRDMLRRLRRQQAERSRRVPVEKDW